MYRKRFMLLVIIALILTGCTKIDNDIDTVVSATMSGEVDRVNTVSTNYKLYVPIGVIQLSDNQYNQKFKIASSHVYLYVDMVSYYYKNNLNYKSSNEYNYYYNDINLNDKVGYVGVNKLDDGSYFATIVYNYAKMEFYSTYEELPFVMANSLIIINSIEYNDNLINLELNDNSNDGKEVTYELDKPEGSQSTFSQVLQEFVEEEKVDIVLPDVE